MDALQGLVRPSSSGALLIKQLTQVGEQREQVAKLIAQVIRDLVAQPGKVNGLAANENLKPAGSTFFSTEVTCLSPRGKCTLSFAEQALLLEGPRNSLQVQWESLQAVAIIDSIPKDTKGRVLLFLYLGSDNAVPYGKQMLDVIVIQTLASEQLDVLAPGGSGRLQGPAPVVLCQALGASKQPHGLSFSSPARECFQSSSGMLAVDAVVKVNQGHLYPMPDALCFLEKPAMMIPLSEIASIEPLRAGDVGSYFDLLITSKQGKRQEFSNLPKSEVAPIMQYIAARGLQAGGSNSPRAQQQALGEDESSSEDSDFDPTKDEEAQGDQPRATVSGHKRSHANGTQASHADNEAASEDIENEEDDDEEEDDDASEDDESDIGSGAELVSESVGSEDEEGNQKEQPASKRRKG